MDYEQSNTQSKKTEGFTLSDIKKRIFNTVSTVFPDTYKALKKKEMYLLHCLETRSEFNHGDTKISDKKLTKIIGKSRQTIARYMKKLEDLGYISRLTVRYKSKTNGGCYCDRVIRCKRIFLKKRFEFRRDLGWKTDNRPDFVYHDTIDAATNKQINIEWKLPWGCTFSDMYDRVFAPAWESTIDLFQMGLLDGEQQQLFHDATTHPDNELYSLILGKKVKMEFI